MKGEKAQFLWDFINFGQMKRPDPPVGDPGGCTTWHPGFLIITLPDTIINPKIVHYPA